MMVQYSNTYTPARTLNGRPLTQMDWAAEITADQDGQPRAASDTGMGGMTSTPGGLSAGAAGQSTDMMRQSGGMAQSGGMTAPNGRLFQNGGELDMKTGLPDEVIQAPTTVDEAYRGSLKAMLARNVGNYVVATFLVGTQGTVAWEGILYDVGNDFVTIYQEARERYIVIDIYSLKYIEFYDTRRRELCESMMRQNGWQNNF
ncbi:hypothetical protein [uncultured Dysosmobacter sp.]|uniref:hypothetical protein n=1 Tax=uncultured Dysosmobacter sp. TaxID=2591384 RepID=UPI00262BF3B1|nr:hypothetical protein [uncultured Dysosmobacter sp.]